jgi:hypothetical protein
MVNRMWNQDDEDAYDSYEEDSMEDQDDEIPCPHCGRSIYDDAVQCPYCHLYVEGSSAVTPPWSIWPRLFQLAAILLILIFLGPAVFMLWMIFQRGLP